MEEIKPEIRYLSDMKDVLMDNKETTDSPLYYMYRGIKEDNGLRYDITVIPPKLINEEFVKTKGHYHTTNHGELYIVLKGEGIFLMQNETDTYFVRAKEGQVIIIESGYAHITINPSLDTTLEMANWVSKECQSNYKPIQENKGAFYYYTTKGWIKNQNYKQVPELKQKEPLSEIPKDLTFLR
jgi:glucose-6-phosphate isomerase, archaeal